MSESETWRTDTSALRQMMNDHLKRKMGVAEPGHDPIWGPKQPSSEWWRADIASYAANAVADASFQPQTHREVVPDNWTEADVRRVAERAYGLIEAARANGIDEVNLIRDYGTAVVTGLDAFQAKEYPRKGKPSITGSALLEEALKQSLAASTSMSTSPAH